MPTLVAVALALALAAPTREGARAAPPPGDAAEPSPLPPHYVVERIELRGLRRTRPEEVEKHVLVRAGDLLDEEAVVLSRLKLVQLGWFSRVETRVERGSARGLVVLVLLLEERNTLLVSEFYVGSTGPQPIYGGLGLAEHNFLGRGLGLAGAFVYGGRPRGPIAPSRLSLRGAFTAPHLAIAGLRAHAGVSAVYVRGEEFTCRDPDCDAFGSDYGDAPRLRYSRAGGALELGAAAGPFSRVVASARVERLEGTHDPRRAAELDEGGGPLPALRLGRSTLTALGLAYLRDTRDDPFFPRAGTRLDASLTLASPALGGDYEYGRYLLQLEAAFAPWRDHGLRLVGALGLVQGDAPFFERFYAADWAYFSLGPALGRALELNFSTDARYDRTLAMAGAEWGVPLWRGGETFHRGWLALGARAVWSAAEAGAGRTDLSRTPFSAETALRFDTPIGAFNVSVGYLLDIVL
jgi:outer membrane protein assembly factor BamA